MIEIANASPKDAHDLKHLLEAAYRGDSARAGWTHEADILDDERVALHEVEELLRDPDATMLTARDCGELIGCVAVTRKSATVGYLGMLCVSPHLQSAGVGRRLLDAAEEHGCALGLSVMQMTVIDSRDALIAWYERRGYKLTGETMPYSALRPVEGTDVTFAVLEKPLNSH